MENGSAFHEGKVRDEGKEKRDGGMKSDSVGLFFSITRNIQFSFKTLECFNSKSIREKLMKRRIKKEGCKRKNKKELKANKHDK